MKDAVKKCNNIRPECVSEFRAHILCHNTMVAQVEISLSVPIEDSHRCSEDELLKKWHEYVIDKVNESFNQALNKRKPDA